MYDFRVMRPAVLVLLGVGLCGCERGCLMRELSDRGKSPGLAAPSAQAFDLTGIDCSDGLLRCANGLVESSRIAHLPTQCMKAGKSPEKQAAECTCPWEVVVSCRTACAEESLEVTAVKSDADARQLCRPEMPVARPVLGVDEASIEVCSDEGTTCRDGIVRICDSGGAPSRPIAYCIFGCAAGLALEGGGDGPIKPPDGPISILCQRSAAEAH